MSSQPILLSLVEKALVEVYAHQEYLIENRVSERSIVFWFGVYFHDLLRETEYAVYNLDVEYNRNLRDMKRTEHFRRGTYPDLILHERGCNKSNILVIEFKTWWNRQQSKDIQKIKDFTDSNGEYNFQTGLFIELGRKEAKIKTLINGEVVDG